MAGLLSLFPEGVEAIQRMSDEEIQAIVVVEGKPHPKVVPAMSGTTALVALIDPERNLYVASLGDCQAGEYYSDGAVILNLHRISPSFRPQAGR